MVECPQGRLTSTEGVHLVHPGLQGDMADLLGMVVVVVMEYPVMNADLTA